jgi:hypothetical protein
MEAPEEGGGKVTHCFLRSALSALRFAENQGNE